MRHFRQHICRHAQKLCCVIHRILVYYFQFLGCFHIFIRVYADFCRCFLYAFQIQRLCENLAAKETSKQLAIHYNRCGKLYEPCMACIDSRLSLLQCLLRPFSVTLHAAAIANFRTPRTFHTKIGEIRPFRYGNPSCICCQGCNACRIGKSVLYPLQNFNIDQIRQMQFKIYIHMSTLFSIHKTCFTR